MRFQIKSNCGVKLSTMPFMIDWLGKVIAVAWVCAALAGCGGGNAINLPHAPANAGAVAGEALNHNSGDLGDPGVAEALADAQQSRATPAAVATSLNPDDYITIQSGLLPVVISAPHGGDKAIPGVAVRTSGTTVMDWNTYQLATRIQAELRVLTGKSAYLVAAMASRKYVDFNRSADLAYENVLVKPIYDRYYGALQNAVSAVKLQAPAAALLVDIHGQSQNARVTYRGTRDGLTAQNTVFYTTPHGLVTSMNASGLNVSPSTAGGRDNANFNGGNIVWSFGKNNSAGINSVQLEFGLNYRNTDADAVQTAKKAAAAIVSHLKATGAL